MADRAELASLVAGHDVVVSAFNPGKDERGTGTRSIIEAVKQAGAFLDDLRGETELNWTFLCSAAMLAPRERAGTCRVGGDQLPTRDDGQSRLSIPDHAVAMLDEAEKPQHPRQRFSVAY